MAKSAEVYRCSSCKHCFIHKDVGDYVMDICPRGEGTISKKETYKHIEAAIRSGRISSKK